MLRGRPGRWAGRRVSEERARGEGRGRNRAVLVGAATAVPRSRRGTFRFVFGEVAGLQRASGATRSAKWAETYPYVGSWG